MSIQALLGKKIGTTQVFKEDTGEAVCVTAIETGPCIVTQIKSSDTDGYEAVQIGFEEVKRGNKPAMGHLDKSGGKLFRHLREVGTSDLASVEVGQQFDAGLFAEGESINVTGVTKGRGFAGVVKAARLQGRPEDTRSVRPASRARIYRRRHHSRKGPEGQAYARAHGR